MRRRFYWFVSVLCVLFATTSCMNSDEVDYSDYNECAITAFAIEDIETSYTTKNASGEDSTYTVTTGSDYTFKIDQLKHEVYNVDSLPKGTDITAVLCSLTSDGTALYQKGDEWSYVSSSDSIDFSKPVTVRIWAYNGVSSKDYTIRINVHQQEGDSTVWTKETTLFAGKALTATRCLTYGNKVAVYGTQNDKLKVTQATLGAMDWSEPVEVGGIGSTAQIDEMVYFSNAFYVIDNQQLYTSTNGVEWTQVTTNTPLSHLYGCNSTTLFGSFNNVFVSTADAMAWQNEATEFADNMPDSNIRTFTHPLNTNHLIEGTVMIGQKANSTDSCAVAWYRESDDNWSYMYTAKDNYYNCPNLNNLTVLDYKEYLIAFGGTRRNSKTITAALAQLYVSKDKGLTWKTQSDESFDVYPTLPADIAGNPNSFTAYVDNESFIWIMFSGSGEVWRGRLNRMGFAE